MFAKSLNWEQLTMHFKFIINEEKVFREGAFSVKKLRFAEIKLFQKQWLLEEGEGSICSNKLLLKYEEDYHAKPIPI